MVKFPYIPGLVAVIAVSAGAALAQTAAPETGPGEPTAERQKAPSEGTPPAGQAKQTPPLEGANSFTEDQARTRIEGAGYSGVKGLTKDDRGVWRATASKNGRSASVALDFQGTIVEMQN